MNTTGEAVRPQPKALFLAFTLTFLTTLGFAQDANFVSSLGDLCQQSYSGAYAMYLPITPWQWQGYSLGEALWLDCSESNLPCAALFATSTNIQYCGVNLDVASAVLVRDVNTGVTTINAPGSTNTIATVAAPAGYYPGLWSEDRGVVWLWNQWTNSADSLESWGEPDGGIVDPTVTLTVLLANAADYGTYASNVDAQAEAQCQSTRTDGEPTAKANDGGVVLMDDSSGDPCVITNETDPFNIVSLAPDGSGSMLLSWQSCTDHIYVVQSETALTPTSSWTDMAWMFGTDQETSWTDTNAVGQVQMFYRVIRASPTNTNNGIPYSWAMQYGLDPIDPNLAYEDPDNDFWSNLAEYQNGTDPTNAADTVPLSFTINGGGAVVSNTQVEIELAPGIIADFAIVSEDSGLASSVTNLFSPVFNYTLQNGQDGIHTLYMQLLKTNGTTSPVFSATVELDTTPPSISITAPSNGAVVTQRRINIQGFAADASITNASLPDASRWLQVTVNGDFANDRDSNGVWWAGPQDLVAGTNTFVAVASDRAGWTATNSVWFIYDPTQATNVPVFTVNTTGTVIVGSTTASFALMGTIDDSNATVQIALLDAVDNTITNATVGTAVHDTNWWGTIPVLPGTNLVSVTAQNSGSLPSTQTFTIIQDTNFFLDITSPAPDSAVNGTNVMVTGIGSLNLSNATITVNGEAAVITVGASNITFSSATPVPLGPGANSIQVQLAGGISGGSGDPAATVYGYEVLAMNYHEDSFSDTGCEWTWTEDENWDVGQPGTYHDTWVWQRCDGTDSSDRDWPMNCSATLPPGDVCLRVAQFGSMGDWSFMWPCSGWSCGHEADNYNLKLTVIKHAASDDEQTVIFHFDNPEYNYWNWPEPPLDPSTIKFRGSKGFWWTSPDGQVHGIGFVIKIRPNIPFTIQNSDFQYPPIPDVGADGFGYSHALYFDGFGNQTVKLNVQVVGQGCNKPDLNQAATRLAISYSGPQTDPTLAAMQQTCQSAGSFSVYVYQGHAGLTNGLPQVAAYTGKVCGLTTNCPAGVPTYDAPFLCFIPIRRWLADAYYLTTGVSPSMVDDFTAGKGMPHLVLIIGCESGTSWQSGFTQAGAKVVLYCGGEGDAATESVAISAFFNTLASSPSSTIDQALSAANAIIDTYNMHPGAIGQMSDMTAVYGSGASAASTFADIIKP